MIKRVEFYCRTCKVEDISYTVDLITVLEDRVPGGKRDAVCPCSSVMPGQGCLIFDRKQVDLSNPIFKFAEGYFFDIALPLSAFPEIQDIIAETFCDLEMFNFAELPSMGRYFKSA